jgi:hypothetical protein
MTPMIAIVGSADPRREGELGLQNLSAARPACEALGRALAEAGCDIAVYSSAASFVEGDIVRGYVSSGNARPNSIRVWIPEGGDEAFPERQDDDTSFRVTVDTTEGWEVSFYRSLFAVDGVLLVGGGQSTLVAGLIALSNRTPVVAVASFGGRAKEVWRALDRAKNDATPEHIEAMGRGWRPGMENELVSSLLEQRQRRADREAEDERARGAYARQRRNSLIVAALAILVALAAIVVVYKTTPKSTASLVALLVAPLLAGAAGAIIRTVIDDGHEWLKTGLLGIGAGLIASLLFVASQLATSPEALEDEGVTTLIVFEVVVAFIAGVTFDAVFAKIRKQDVVDVTPLERT